MNIVSLDQLTPKQLRRAAWLKERIESLQKELQRIVGAVAAPASAPRKAAKGKRKVSAAAKAKLRQIALARWAKRKAQGKSRL